MPPTLQPWNMISYDDPIYQAICTDIAHLSPIHVNLIHVDGHLDTQKTKTKKLPKFPLTEAETLNIEYDKQANQHAQSSQPRLHTHNPLLKHSFPHLCIDNKIIHQHLTPSLQDAATPAKYLNYLLENFQWEPNYMQNIHWPALSHAMHCLNKSEWRIISKFVHKWLPLETWYHVMSQFTLQQCLSCQHNLETTEHFCTALIQTNHFRQTCLATLRSYPYSTVLPTALWDNLTKGIHSCTKANVLQQPVGQHQPLYSQHQL